MSDAGTPQHDADPRAIAIALMYAELAQLRAACDRLERSLEVLQGKRCLMFLNGHPSWWCVLPR